MMKGNEVIAHAAIRYGCDGYFGYPITPQSEVMETLMEEKPWETTGMVVLQAESEVSSINMVYGGASTGKRVMTSSSSPGVSLMSEGLSYLAGAELPCVVVNCQRGGPGLGGIQPSQSDYFLATRGPGHGDFHVLVLAPASVQEMADLTQKAFRLAFKYRMPAMLLADGTMGQMMEPVVLPEETVLEKSAPDWAVTGTECKREHNIINSLYLSPAELEQKNIERFERYAKLAEEETMWEAFMMEDADVCVVSCGITARVSRNAIVEARKQGIKAGMIRPITLWPFPKKELNELADTAKVFLSVEMSMGQMVDDVRLAVNGKRPVHFFGRTGGIIPSVDEVYAEIKKLSEVI